MTLHAIYDVHAQFYHWAQNPTFESLCRDYPDLSNLPVYEFDPSAVRRVSDELMKDFEGMGRLLAPLRPTYAFIRVAYPWKTTRTRRPRYYSVVVIPRGHDLFSGLILGNHQGEIAATALSSDPKIVNEVSRSLGESITTVKQAMISIALDAYALRKYYASAVILRQHAEPIGRRIEQPPKDQRSGTSVTSVRIDAPTIQYPPSGTPVENPRGPVCEHYVPGHWAMKGGSRPCDEALDGAHRWATHPDVPHWQWCELCAAERWPRKAFKRGDPSVPRKTITRVTG